MSRQAPPHQSIELEDVTYYGESLLNTVSLEIGVFTTQLAASLCRWLAYQKIPGIMVHGVESI